MALVLSPPSACALGICVNRVSFRAPGRFEGVIGLELTEIPHQREVYVCRPNRETCSAFTHNSNHLLNSQRISRALTERSRSSNHLDCVGALGCCWTSAATGHSQRRNCCDQDRTAYRQQKFPELPILGAEEREHQECRQSACNRNRML